MTIPSNFQELGLSLTFSDPLVKTDRDSLAIDFNSSNITSYSHEIRRVGGYYNAKMSFNDSEENINNWIQNGIGRHIEVYNPSGVMIWEGFVDTMSVNIGEGAYSVGPLSAIGNRRSVTYSTIDTSTDPPTLGTRETTASADNDTSIDKYGIWHKITGINGAVLADAEQIRDQFINDPTRTFPAVSGDIIIGGGTFNISLDLLGYWQWFKAYYYSKSATGDTNLSDKIEEIITADPNGIFSSDYDKITENTTQVADGWSGKQTAMTILKDLNQRGDSSDNPYAIGVYNNRRVYYEIMPTTIEYQKRRGEQVTGKLENTVNPWDIKPNEWIFRPDFLVGQHPPITSETLGADPRVGLIETVKFTAPNGLNVNGIKLSQLDQSLARRGLGGMS